MTTAAVLVGGCSAPERRPSSPVSAAHSVDLPVRVGVSLPSQHYDPDAVTAWEEAVGHPADVLQTFVPWEYERAPHLNGFPVRRVAAIADAGRVVEITWTPAEPSDGGGPGISLAGIADGAHDDYVREFARDVRDSGSPIRLRFAHEMNGTWSRWSESHPANGSGSYVRAWRHLHDLFQAEGANNVTWVWSPNVRSDRTVPLGGLYPGDAYVDEVGIDGYSTPRNGCLTPSALFTATIQEARAVSTRPVALAEVGVATSCPDRGRWVADLFDLVQREELVGVTWWERSGDPDDYRIVPEDAALQAYREALADR